MEGYIGCPHRAGNLIDSINMEEGKGRQRNIYNDG